MAWTGRMEQLPAREQVDELYATADFYWVFSMDMRTDGLLTTITTIIHAGRTSTLQKYIAPHRSSILYGTEHRCISHRTCSHQCACSTPS